MEGTKSFVWFLFDCPSLKRSDDWAFCLGVCVYCLLILHTDKHVSNPDHWDHSGLVKTTSLCHYHKSKVSLSSLICHICHRLYTFV